MDKRSAALDLAKRGFRVFPLVPNGKEPAISRDFSRRATSDEATVREWWTEAVTGDSTNDNIGISTDELLVVDFDDKGETPAMVAEFEQVNGQSYVVATPSGGCHLYYRLPPGVRCGNTHKPTIGKTIDTRSWHGYVVGPGSAINGKQYQWRSDRAPDWIGDLAVTLPRLIDACGAPKERAPIDEGTEWDTPAALAKATDWLKTAAPSAQKGNRGSTAYRVAARCRDHAVSEPTTLSLMTEHWNVDGRVEPPMPADDLATSVDHAYRYATSSPMAPGSEFEAVEIEEPADRSKAAVGPNGSGAETIPEDWPSPTFLNKFDPADLPKRQWIVPGILARTFLTGLIAPSGAGKTQLLAQTCLAIAANRPDIVSAETIAQTAIWCWNQEDDLTELKRRIGAAILHFGIDWDRAPIYLDSGVEKPLILVARDKDGNLRETKYVNKMIKHMRDKGIGVLIIDPLVEFHHADENNNVEMRIVGAALRRIAVEANAAVIVGHHTRKPEGGKSDGFAGSADSGRGASALQGVTRIMFTLYTMGLKDAKEWGIKESERDRYVRLDSAKSNISASALGSRPHWFERTGQLLSLEGDNVGVLKPVVLARTRVEKEERRMGETVAIAAAIAEAMGDVGEGVAVKWRDIEARAAEITSTTIAALRKKTINLPDRTLIDAGPDWQIKIIRQPGAAGNSVKRYAREPIENNDELIKNEE